VPNLKWSVAAADNRSSLRSDAARNRDRILIAAREVFAEFGLDVALEVIARRAGISLATLSRRFSREQIVEAVFVERAENYLQLAEEALQAPTGWEGFCHYLEHLCAIHAADRAATDVMTLRMPSCPRITTLRREIYKAQLELIHRAQQEGPLLLDFVPEDVLLIVIAVGGVANATAPSAPGAWRRVYAMLLTSLATPQSDLPAAPTARAMIAAVSAPRRGRRPGSATFES
jgi:AcrR family transcriptional regulator